jgi:uncharacterized glyoxalase superfamily protein PhnB
MTRRPAITPILWYDKPADALAWLERAFGFETRMVVAGDDGGVIHSETWLGEACVGVVGPPMRGTASPQTTGRVTQQVHIQLEEGIDAHCEKARAAGAVIEREPTNQAYGDRTYGCRDPEGHPWSFGMTIQAMTIEEQAAATGRPIASSLTDIAR